MKINVTFELELPQDGEKLARLAELSGVTLAPTGTVTAAPAAPKTRTKKEKPAESAPSAPTPSGDPLMQAETSHALPPAAPQVPASVAVLTEEQSLEKAKDLAKKLVEAFPQKGADNRPQGFRMALDLLAKFKVARTTDLVHADRLTFIAEGEAMLAKAPAV